MLHLLILYCRFSGVGAFRGLEKRKICISLIRKEIQKFLLFLIPHTGALTKVKESQKHVEEGKMDRAQAEGINERCNIISFATLAEIQHFHQIRVRDFKAQMQHYLQQQITFFQKITGKLEEALQKYDNA